MDAISEKAKHIKLLIVDIDGVLTDGTLYYTDEGTQLKGFHCHDGVGLKLLLNHDVEVAVITSHQTQVVKTRINALGITHLYQGYSDKLPAYHDIVEKLQLQPEQIAYVGDDLPDIPIIRRVGLGIAVANASALVKQHAVWETQKSGGQGAIREVSEFILQAQDKLDAAHEKYLA